MDKYIFCLISLDDLKEDFPFYDEDMFDISMENFTARVEYRQLDGIIDSSDMDEVRYPDQNHMTTDEIQKMADTCDLEFKSVFGSYALCFPLHYSIRDRQKTENRSGVMLTLHQGFETEYFNKAWQMFRKKAEKITLKDFATDSQKYWVLRTLLSRQFQDYEHDWWSGHKLGGLSPFQNFVYLWNNGDYMLTTMDEFVRRTASLTKGKKTIDFLLSGLIRWGC